MVRWCRRAAVGWPRRPLRRLRRIVVTLITRFVTETAAWGWDDVPARVLFTRGDIPKIPKPLPRFIPDHELAKLMIAVDELPNRYQRVALIVDPSAGREIQHIFGTQLAEGGARIQTIMAVLGHRTANMSIIYASLSDPTVNSSIKPPSTATFGPDITLAGPAADSLREHRLDPEAVSWLQTNFLKTEHELGHCLRTPAEGPCECDLVLTCSKFLTTSDYVLRLRARIEVEQQLIDDATARSWPREIERHEATKRRLEQLLHDLA